MQGSFYFLKIPWWLIRHSHDTKKCITSKKNLNNKGDPVVIEVVCPSRKVVKNVQVKAKKDSRNQSVFGVLDLLYLMSISPPFPRNLLHWPCSQLQGSMLNLQKKTKEVWFSKLKNNDWGIQKAMQEVELVSFTIQVIHSNYTDIGAHKIYCDWYFAYLLLIFLPPSSSSEDS